MIAYRIAMRAAAMISAISLGLAIGFASPAPVFADPVTPEESDADMAMALQIADGYWRNHWSQYFTGTYTPPRVVGLYDSRTTQLACGGAPVPTGNALFAVTGRIPVNVATSELPGRLRWEHSERPDAAGCW